METKQFDYWNCVLFEPARTVLLLVRVKCGRVVEASV
jgi:hypothetical protein